MHTKFLKFLHKSSRTNFSSFILFQGLKLKVYRSVLMSSNWVDISKDTNTGIETIRAHFTGHAYDPHWHSSYLIGVTESGIQQFHCRKSKSIVMLGKSLCLSQKKFMMDMRLHLMVLPTKCFIYTQNG